MSSQVEFDGLAEGCHFIVVEVSLSVCFSDKITLELIEGSIEVVHIGLMVFLVMSFQQFAAQDRLEGRVAILEIR